MNLPVGNCRRSGTSPPMRAPRKSWQTPRGSYSRRFNLWMLAGVGIHTGVFPSTQCSGGIRRRVRNAAGARQPTVWRTHYCSLWQG